MNFKGQLQALLFLIALFTAQLCSAQSTTNLLSLLEPVPPFPELRTAAKSDGIPLEGFSASMNSNSLTVGDSLTALVTLHQKGNHRTQWLIRFEVTAAGNTHSGKPDKPEVLYNSMGDKFEFSNSPATFRIRAIGPYVDTASFWGQPVPKDKYAQTDVNSDSLGIGMDKAAAAIHRIYLGDKGATNFDVWASDKPPSDSRAAKNKKIAAALKITPQEERALAGWYPALWSYFNTVGETPNLESILYKVVSLPSMWSIVKHAGVTAWISVEPQAIEPISLSGWNLPTRQSIYTLPMRVTLNQRPALYATLLVTDPHPPLLACSGIVGFVAQNPNDAENYMTFRVISASCSTNVLAKTANDLRK
jgi:hypothetical protein